MGHETSWDLLIFFFRRNFWDPVPPNRLHFFFTDFVRRRNSTTQIVYLTSAVFFFWRNFWGPVPPNRLHFLTDFVFCFSAELHYTNCVPDLCWKYFFSAELSIYSDLWFGGTQHYKMCSGLLLIQWFSLGFLLKKIIFGGTQRHKMCAWVLLICLDFRRKFISLVTERPCSIFSHWLVAGLHLTQLQWKRIGVSLNFRTLNSKYAPFNWWTPGALTYILIFLGIKSCMGNITLPHIYIYNINIIHIYIYVFLSRYVHTDT